MGEDLDAVIVPAEGAELSVWQQQEGVLSGEVGREDGGTRPHHYQEEKVVIAGQCPSPKPKISDLWPTFLASLPSSKVQLPPSLRVLTQVRSEGSALAASSRLGLASRPEREVEGRALLGTPS